MPGEATGASCPGGRCPRRSGRNAKDGGVSTVYDCGAPDSRAAGLAAAKNTLEAGRLAVVPTDTLYGIAANAFDGAAVAALLAAKRPRPGHARPGAGRLLAHHRRSRLLGAAAGPRTDPRVLARRAESGGAAGAVAGLGPRRHARHRHAPDAAAPGRAGVAARGRAAGGVEREHVRIAARDHRRSRPATSWASWSASTSTAVPPSTRWPRRSSTSPPERPASCARARCRPGPSPRCSGWTSAR